MVDSYCSFEGETPPFLQSLIMGCTSSTARDKSRETSSGQGRCLDPINNTLQTGIDQLHEVSVEISAANNWLAQIKVNLQSNGV